MAARGAAKGLIGSVTTDPWERAKEIRAQHPELVGARGSDEEYEETTAILTDPELLEDIFQARASGGQFDLGGYHGEGTPARTPVVAERNSTMQAPISQVPTAPATVRPVIVADDGLDWLSDCTPPKVATPAPAKEPVAVVTPVPPMTPPTDEFDWMSDTPTPTKAQVEEVRKDDAFGYGFDMPAVADHDAEISILTSARSATASAPTPEPLKAVALKPGSTIDLSWLDDDVPAPAVAVSKGDWLEAPKDGIERFIGDAVEVTEFPDDDAAPEENEFDFLVPKAKSPAR